MGNPEPTEGAPEPQEAPADDAAEQEKPNPEGEAEAGEAEAKGEEGEEAEAEAKEEGEAEADEGGEEAEPDEKHRRAGGWRRKIERLERQIEHLQTQRTGPALPQKPEAEKTPDEKAAAYIDGLVERRLSEREARRQQETAVAEFQRRTAEVRAKYDDFDDVVLSADAPVSAALQEALLTSEHGPSIMYQLAKNPAELARLSALPPLVAAREIGRLEAKQSSSTAAPKTAKSAMRPPAPPASVNGTSSKTRNIEDLPISEYKRAYRSGRR